MTDLQERMLLLLTELDGICRKHDIKYMLFAGTGLGAARHRGFIPWDDDTDIIMDLENFEKFLGVIGDELPEDRVFDWVSEDSDYLFTYARYVDTTSTALQRHTVFGGVRPGIKVDIFCVIPTFTDAALQEKHRMDVLGFAEVLCATGKMGMYRPQGFYEVFEREKKKAQKAGRAKYIEDNLHELTHRADGETKKCMLFCGMMSNTKIYDRCIFDETVYVPFETTELPVSTRNDLFLTQHIAESWPDLPTRVEMQRHLLFVDVDRPYGDYIKLLASRTDLDKVREASVKRKENNLYEREAFRDVLTNGQKLRNLAVEMDIRRRFADYRPDMSADEKAAFFGKYIAGQMEKLNRTFGICVEAGDEILREALEVLILTGRYYDARSLLRTCAGAGSIDTGSPWVQEILAKTDLCIELVDTAFRFGDRDKAARLLEQAGALEGSAAYEAVRGWLAGGAGSKGYPAYLNAFGKVRNAFVLQEMIDDGQPIDSVFEFTEAPAPKADKTLLRTTVNALMTGKPSRKPAIFSDAVTQKEYEAEAAGRGLLSKEQKKRYQRYRLWRKMKRRKPEEAFDAYAKVFSELTRITT